MKRYAVLGLAVVLSAAWIGVHPSDAGAVTQAARALRLRYSPPRVPVRPPAVRPATNAAQALRQQSIDASVRALTVANNTARDQLRRALSNGAGVRMGKTWNAHHVIPWNFRSHPTIQKAARGGFNLNGAGNGLRIPAAEHRRLHGALNDPHNGAAVTNLLNTLHTTRAHYTAEQTAIVVQNHARTWKYDMIGSDSVLSRFNSEATVTAAARSAN